MLKRTSTQSSRPRTIPAHQACQPLRNAIPRRKTRIPQPAKSPKCKQRRAHCPGHPRHLESVLQSRPQAFCRYSLYAGSRLLSRLGTRYFYPFLFSWFCDRAEPGRVGDHCGGKFEYAKEAGRTGAQDW